MPKTVTHESQWAQLGAAVRLQQIRAEIAEIYAAFPALTQAETAGRILLQATSPPSPSEAQWLAIKECAELRQQQGR
jgi:hypothetical protein